MSQAKSSFHLPSPVSSSPELSLSIPDSTPLLVSKLEEEEDEFGVLLESSNSLPDDSGKRD